MTGKGQRGKREEESFSYHMFLDPPLESNYRFLILGVFANI